MKWTLSFFFMITALYSVGQSRYFIKDLSSGDPLPFVKVKPNIGTPLLADIDGIVDLSVEATRIELKLAGYRDTLVVLSEVAEQTIFMTGLVKEIQEVTVLAGENPAHRIIDHAIENRKKNDPLSNDAFRYDSYSKFIFTADQEALAAIPDTTTDSTNIKIRKFFNEQHLFMLESASTRTFLPPSRDKEEITAYKVSGFSDPMFSTFANEMQSFSFYDNQFSLMGKTYINPIAFGGTKRYLFILEDTTVVNSDTTFTIFYRPRKGRNFEGMTGHLYINSNGWAIEKVTASPYEDTTGMKIRIIQEYAYLNGRKWFPQKLSTEIDLGKAAMIEYLTIEGKGSTYIKNVVFDPDGIRKRDFDNVSVSTVDGAGDVKDKDWDTMRVYSITDQEKRTYEMVDSLSKAEKLDQRLVALKALTEGKIPLGNFNLDLARLLNYNLYEKYRFGFGLETSKKLMKFATVGGYFAWATRDKEFKYGGYSTFHLNRKNGVKLNLRYQQDLLERGGHSFQKDVFTLNNTSMYRQFFITNMDRQRLGEISLSGNIRSNMKITLIANYQRIWLTEDYLYFPWNDVYPLSPTDGFDLAETSIEFTWNIRENVMMLGDQRISKGTRWPKLQFKYTKGHKGIFESDFSYDRLMAEIQQDIPIRGLGKFTWTLAGQHTEGNVPLTLLHVGNGTGRNWNLDVPNTFQTMAPSEFYNESQFAFYTRMNFNAFKTKAKWNEPQIALHHAIGYGENNSPDGHSLVFETMEKGYYEGGLILNGIMTTKFYGIGVGGFYRYGSYSNADWKKNIVPKITLTVNL
jgi:hypothetical protein